MAGALVFMIGLHAGDDAARGTRVRGENRLQAELDAGLIRASQRLEALLARGERGLSGSAAGVGRRVRVPWIATPTPPQGPDVAGAERLEMVQGDRAAALRAYGRIGADGSLGPLARARAWRGRARLLSDPGERRAALQQAVALAPAGSRCALLAAFDLARHGEAGARAGLARRVAGAEFRRVHPRERLYIHRTLEGKADDRLPLLALSTILDAPDPAVPVRVGSDHLAWKVEAAAGGVTLCLADLDRLLAHTLDGYGAGRWRRGPGRIEAPLKAPFPSLAVAAGEGTLHDLEGEVRHAWRQRLLLGAGAAVLLLGAGVALFLLQRKRNQLEERKRNFICAITHELKTPVGNIRLFADTIGAHAGRDPDKVPRFAAIIAEEAERLRARIDEVLAVAAGRRLPGAEEEPFDPAGEVLAVARDYARQAKAGGLRIACSMPSESMRLPGSPERFKGIVDGLLGNAVKFSTPEARHGDTITVSLGRREDRLVLQVEDQGPGVPAADRERIFEPFLRLGDEMTREVQGTGLGLALVRKLAEEFHGEVRAGRGRTGGALFTVTLPLAESRE